MAINLMEEEVQAGPQIDLTGNSAVASPVTAELQTERYSYAMNDKLPPQQIRDSVLLGFEDILREQAYYNDALEDRAKKSNLITQVSQAAAAEGRGLNDDEIAYVTDLATQGPNTTPSTILETLYGRRFTQDLAAEAEAVYAQEQEPEGAEIVFSATEDYSTKQQIAMKIFEEQQDRFGEAGFGTQAIDFAEGLVPGLSWLRTQSRITGTNNEGAFLSGSNIESQIQSLYLQNPADFEANLRQAVENLSQDSVFDAMHLAQAAVSYASSDAIWDNTFAALDAADVATLGAGAAIKLGLRAQKAVRAAGHGTSVARQVAHGDIAGASRSAVAARLSNGEMTVNPAQGPSLAAGNTRPQQQIDEIINAYPGMFDPQAYFRNAGSLTATRQTRLMNELADSQGLLMSTLDDVSHIQRVTDKQAISTMMDQAERRFRVTNHRLDQSIVDVVPVNESAEVFGGVDYVKVLIGTKDAEGFVSEAAARNHAQEIYRLAGGGYDIENFQGNWFITMTQNVDETALDVQLHRIQTTNQAPESFVNSWLWGLRSADDVVSHESNHWRKVATYGANAVQERMRAALKNFGKLGKNETDRLREVMEDAQTMTRVVTQPDGTQKRVAGWFYDTVGDFETAYMAKHRMMPSDREIGAYFEFRNIMDWDLMMKNLASYRDKARLGMQQYSVTASVPVPGTKDFSLVNTPFFEGRVVDSLPTQSSGSFTVGWVGGKKSKPVFGIYDKLFRGQREELEELVASGEAQIIQVGDPKAKELRDLFNAKGEPVQFIVTMNPAQKPLSFNQVPRNEGGHWMYSETASYLKQAQVHMGQGRRIYDGDVTAFHGQSFEMLEGFAEKFNNARNMVKSNDPRLDQYVTSNLPFKSGSEFSALFRTKANPDAPFNLDTPFVTTQHGQSARDVTKLEDIFQEQVFDSSGDANSLSSKITSQWTQERSERLLSVDTVGTQANPVYKLSQAPLVDPMRALSIAGSAMARGRFYDDYKFRAVEDWISQFADVLDAPLADIRADPMRYIKEGNFRDTRDNVKLAAAKANRRAILSILGQDTDFHKAWKWTRQKLVDQAYAAGGKRGANIVDPILFDSKHDPATIMRSMVFHAKLGLFNPAQLLLQSVSASMAIAIDGSPLRAARAPMAYWAMRSMGISSVNPKGSAAIAKTAAKALGLDAKYLDEMHEAWTRSGMNVVEGEYGPLDDYLNPRDFVSTTSGQKALNMGTFFFKEGNNVHRGTSFSLAYMRWRDANPTKALTNKDLSEIVNRADLYYINMSRASNAPWQSGGKWWQQGTAVMGQFFGFQARLTELMLGNRLSVGEKIRLFTMNSLLWGVPIGGGGTLLGAFWPVGESIKEHMIANDIDGNSDQVTRFITDGVLDVMVESLVGQDMNVAERFGPGGLSYLKDFTEGNFGELFGASPNFLSQSMALTEPFLMYASGAIFGGPQFDLQKEDFLAVAQEISSVNQSLRAYMAFTSGDWLNKKESLIGENVVDKEDPGVAIAIALGLTPQDITDMYLRYQDNASIADAKRQITDLALREFERGIKASVAGDEEQALNFFRRASAFMESGDFTPLERSQVYRRAMQDNGTMMERVDKEFLMNNPEVRAPWYTQRWEERLTRGY